MIKFRQKEFIAPVVAAALIGAGGSIAAGGSSIIAGKKQNEAQAEMQRKQIIADKKAQAAEREAQKEERKLEEKKIKAAQQQERKIMQLAQTNPQAAAAVKPTITVNSRAYSNVELRQANFFDLDSAINVVTAGSNCVSAASNIRSAKLEAKATKEAADKNLKASMENSRARIIESNNKTATELKKLETQGLEFKANLKANTNSNNNKPKTYKVQRNYSAIKEGAGFVKNLGTIAKGRGLNKVLAAAAVTGAVSGAGSYLVDRAIQKDVKKSGILKIEKPELTEEEKAAKKKKRNRKLLLAAGTTAALVGGGIAAKKGKFGADAKELVNKVTVKSIKNKAKSGANTVKEATKDYFAPVDKETGKRKVDKLNLAITGVSTAAPAAIYALNKKQLKDQIKQSEVDADNSKEKEKTYSKIKINTNSFKKAASVGKTQLFNSSRGKKEYAGAAGDSILRARANKLYAPKGRTERYKVKDWWNKFKNKPGETFLDTLSFRTGGGGKKGVRGFGEDLIKLGKETGNSTSQKVGKFIKKNPKTAMLGSAALGFGVIRTAKRKLGRATSEAIEKIDPNAYAYAKYGAQPIPDKRDNEEEKDD